MRLFEPGGNVPLLTLLDYRNFGTLAVRGLDGADEFNVYVAPTGPGTGHRDLLVDGGLPSSPGSGGGPGGAPGGGPGSGPGSNKDRLTVYWAGMTPPPPPPGPPPSNMSPVDHDKALDRFFVDYDPLHEFTIDYLDVELATASPL